MFERRSIFFYLYLYFSFWFDYLESLILLFFMAKGIFISDLNQACLGLLRLNIHFYYFLLILWIVFFSFKVDVSILLFKIFNWFYDRLRFLSGQIFDHEFIGTFSNISSNLQKLINSYIFTSHHPKRSLNSVGIVNVKMVENQASCSIFFLGLYLIGTLFKIKIRISFGDQLRPDLAEVVRLWVGLAGWTVRKYILFGWMTVKIYEYDGFSVIFTFDQLYQTHKTRYLRQFILFFGQLLYVPASIVILSYWACPGIA